LLDDIDTTCTPNAEVRTFLNDIWQNYGFERAQKLVDMTHDSAPWLDAVGNPYSDEITQPAMRSYFCSLLSE
jgi:uncharacterized phage-associated protein